MPHSYMCHASFIYVTCLIHIYSSSLIYATRLVHRKHEYVLYTLCLIYVRDTTHPQKARSRQDILVQPALPAFSTHPLEVTAVILYTNVSRHPHE